ncbi:iron-containing redox enzyme family protein [Dyella flava]|uniref:Iron-containing redox enzyme family protein n=1 Tax=Dyella flava TaxID=1920170 RepID=A0ABS2K790_9GAMM|nr:iron-containing redox enzyme family protein [Dyella flava]MBM7126769.1 iron-containing redox enzyme family protein [Dyella flava]
MNATHPQMSTPFNSARVYFWRAMSENELEDDQCDDIIASQIAHSRGELFAAARDGDQPTLLPRGALATHVPQLSEIERAALISAPLALLQLAPLQQVAGAHLAGAVQLAHVHQVAGAALLRIHARTVGNGSAANGQAHAFDTLLRKSGFVLPEVHASAFTFDPRFDDESFALPSFLLSLGLARRRHFHAAIGAAMLLALAGPILTDAETSRVDVEDLETAVIHCIEVEGEAARLGIEQGFAAARALLEAFLTHLRARLDMETQQVAERRVLDVLKKIGTCPFGYHKRGRMAGRPIDSFFVPETFSPSMVLQALARSPYVVPGAPEKSRLLTELTQPDGPMFRVFPDDDLAALASWVKQLAPTRDVSLARTQILDRALPVVPADPPPGLPPRRMRRPSLRELYYRLVNLELHEDGRRVAREYARQWLARHAVRLDHGRTRLPFSRYSHGALRDWLDQQHATQVSSYQPLEGAPDETCEQVVRDALQLAPLTLIDGAWLRGFVQPAWVGTPIGATLYRIYADELGNVDTVLHHGNIYRDLLRSMGHVLPDFTSREFAEHPDFDDSAFKVPVFWLSVSLFPRDFLPEILGLNLAMELSGVGGQYRRSGEVLAHYGFSAQFTELHNSIDNVATGHTAWAISAIQSYLDDTYLQGGGEQVDVQWRRVWTGYRALQSPAWHTLFSAALPRLIR